jgi:hypothetical protein
MKFLGFWVVGHRDTSLKWHEVWSMQEVFMMEIGVRNGINKTIGHAGKPKLVLMLVLILRYL